MGAMWREVAVVAIFSLVRHRASAVLAARYLAKLVGWCFGVRRASAASLPAADLAAARWGGALDGSLGSMGDDDGGDVEPVSLDAQHRVLQSLGAARVPHLAGASLLTHVAGCAQRVSELGLPLYAVSAALHHSAYGSETFPPQLYKLTEREQVAARIGRRAEMLAFVFGTASQLQLYKDAITMRTLPENGLRVVNCYTGESFVLARETAALLLALHAADVADAAGNFNEFSVHLLRLAAPALGAPKPPPGVDGALSEHSDIAVEAALRTLRARQWCNPWLMMTACSPIIADPRS